MLEVVSKRPLGLNQPKADKFSVLDRDRPILEIFQIWMLVPRSCPADLGREILNPIGNFETTSHNFNI